MAAERELTVTLEADLEPYMAQVRRLTDETRTRWIEHAWPRPQTQTELTFVKPLCRTVDSAIGVASMVLAEGNGPLSLAILVWADERRAELASRITGAVDVL